MIGYDEILAHLIQAGSDALIVPSRFEPCGLTQLCALRYGAVPIVSRVGGLEDTIVDIGEADTSDRDATGFKFAPVTVEALSGTLRKANTAFHNKATWRRLQLSGLATDVSWRNRAGDYAALYRDLDGGRRASCGHPLRRPLAAHPPRRARSDGHHPRIHAIEPAWTLSRSS